MAKKFEVAINKTWCKGCGLCVELCPRKVLELDARQKCEAAHTENCIGCRQCDNICPDLAITVREEGTN